MATPFKLSEQWDHKTNRFQFYKRFIGGKNHVFTQDRAQSSAVGKALIEAWARLSSEGKGWSDEVIRSCYAKGGIRRHDSSQTPVTIQKRTSDSYQTQSISGMDLTNFNTVATPTTQPKKPSKMLHASIDAWLASYKGGVSHGRYIKCVSDMKVYKGYQKDVPLSEIDADVLIATVAHFKSRPMTSHGAPMAIATVMSQIKSIKSVLDWCDMTENWVAPRRFDKMFRVKYSSLRTPMEMKKEALGIETFEVAELAHLWGAATGRQRLYLGLALNTGETAQGLADLLKADLLKNKDGWVIDRQRGKTGVRGVYPLWPEVQKLLEVEMDRTSSPLLLLTERGNPLVHPTKSGGARIDTVASLWNQSILWNVRKKVRPLSFKHLRKTGSTMVEKLTGSEKVAQMYLSHTSKTVASKNYLGKDFSDLAAALLKMHQHLAPMFNVVTSGTSTNVAAA